MVPIGDLLAQALAAFAALTPEQQAAHLAAQRESFAAGNLAVDRASLDPDADPGPYRASRCPCGHRGCRDWHVSPVAAVQGVGFTEVQARAIADLLNRDVPCNAEKASHAATRPINDHAGATAWYDGLPNLDPWFVDLRRWTHATRCELTPSQAYLHVQAATDLPTLDQTMIARVDAIMAHLGYEEVMAEGGRAVYRRKVR